MVVEPDVLEALRERAERVRPPSALKDAVMRDLAERPARRLGRLVLPAAWARLALGVASAAAILVATLLAGRGIPADPCPARRAPAPDSSQAIAAARARNRALYEREKDRLHRDLPGKWVLIADRAPEEVEGAFKPLVVGETLASVASLAADAKHRFVFRVGDEGDVNSGVPGWGGPRLAGSGFLKATGLTSSGGTGGDGIELRKGDEAVTFGDASPFPRIRVGIEAPAGTLPEPPEAREVLLGAAGPTLMLTPDDDARLRLARWEVPGTETVGDVPCRRVLVRVSIPDLDTLATVVAAVPDVPAETLVAKARDRHRFWEWPEAQREALNFEDDVLPPGEPRWLVFGNDRVLGVGRSPGTALAAAAAYRDVVYHRYVLPWPRGAGRIVKVEDLTGRGTFALGDAPPSLEAGSFVPMASAVGDAVLLWRCDEATWVRAGLARNECGEDVTLLEQGDMGIRATAAYVRAHRGLWVNGRLTTARDVGVVLVVRDPRR